MREGEAKERRRGRVRGSRGSRRRRGEGPRRRGGEGRRQAGRWRGATARACAVSLLCLLAEVEDDWHQASGLGCPLGQPGKGPGKTLSPFSNYFSFSILQVCFEFGFETNSIYFASDNIFRS